jgi:hypothetical protein
MDHRDGRPLHERVAALERTITDGHADEGLPDAARMDARLDDLESTVEDLGDQVAELDAAVQALRGFAGGVRAVDEAVERRADAAVARVDRLEAELAEVREAVHDPDDATAVTEPNGREPATARTHDADAGSRVPPSRSDPTVAGERATNGDGGAGHGTRDHDDGHGDSLNDDVAARTDAALADAAAMVDDPEEDEDRSLADRIRRLL